MRRAIMSYVHSLTQTHGSSFSSPRRQEPTMTVRNSRKRPQFTPAGASQRARWRIVHLYRITSPLPLQHRFTSRSCTAMAVQMLSTPRV